MLKLIKETSLVNKKWESHKVKNIHLTWEVHHLWSLEKLKGPRVPCAPKTSLSLSPSFMSRGALKYEVELVINILDRHTSISKLLTMNLGNVRERYEDTLYSV